MLCQSPTKIYEQKTKLRDLDLENTKMPAKFKQTFYSSLFSFQCLLHRVWQIQWVKYCFHLARPQNYDEKHAPDHAQRLMLFSNGIFD